MTALLRVASRLPLQHALWGPHNGQTLGALFHSPLTSRVPQTFEHAVRCAGPKAVSLITPPFMAIKRRAQWGLDSATSGITRHLTETLAPASSFYLQV